MTVKRFDVNLLVGWGRLCCVESDIEIVERGSWSQIKFGMTIIRWDDGFACFVIFLFAWWRDFGKRF